MADSTTMIDAAANPATSTTEATGVPQAAGTPTAAGARTAAGTTSTDCPFSGALTADSQLDQDILDAMATLIRLMFAQGERIAGQYAVPLFCIKALHILDSSMTMKELGQRMKCDPSFVTAIADTLEKNGLARREPSAADRRVKNLVLSAAGIELKRQVEIEMVASMPWSRALDTAEQESFLALIHKLIDAETATQADATAASPATPTGGGRAGEVSEALDAASAG